MAKKVILGGVVGGVLVFLWGAVAHMALPLGCTGISAFPGDKEEAVLAAMKGAVPKEGLYFFPGLDRHRELSESEQRAWQAKLEAGPSGILVIHPEGGEAMSPRQLGTQLGTDVLAALLASILLAGTQIGYVRRVGFVTLLGIFGWVTIGLPYWNWYGFPADFILAAGLERGIAWLIAGLALAAIVRPVRVEAPAEAEAA
jgi:hypothetical protein